MRATVTVSELVDARPERVFALFADAGKHQRWSGGLEYISATGLLEAGMVYQTTHVMLGREIKSENLVVRIEPDRVLAIQNASGPLSYHVVYSLVPRGQGTQVTCYIEIESQHVAFRLAAPVFEMMVESQIQRDMERLKDAVERSEFGEAIA
jgi:carbon monoxide dehydrogenase subunit G